MPRLTVATTEWTDTISDDLIDIVLAAATPRHGETPLLGTCEIHTRVGQCVDSLSTRSIVSVLLEALLRRVRTTMAPHVSGAAFLNLTTRSERHECTRSSFAPDEWARLAELKTSLDPEHRFAHGLDIPTG